MHTYATDSPANPKLVAALAIVSVTVAAVIGLVLGVLNSSIGWHVSGLSSMTCFAALYFIFDNYLWKHRWIRRILLVPDLNGTWTCDGMTVSQDGEALSRAWSGTLEVRQSWSRISIVLSTAQSRSASIAASLYRDPAGGSRLIYHYDNEPSPGERELSRHTGLCRLVFNPMASAGSGNYFTDRDRLTIGTMTLTRGGS